VRRPPPPLLPPPIVAVGVDAVPPVIGAPPPMAASFSVLIGTLDTARAVDLIETTLRAQKLPVYLIDLVMAPGDVRRRILVGRYATREEADAARQKLGPAMTEARVIPGEVERLRIVP
jgi:cell division septation protein DedD